MDFLFPLNFPVLSSMGKLMTGYGKVIYCDMNRAYSKYIVNNCRYTYICAMYSCIYIKINQGKEFGIQKIIGLLDAFLKKTGNILQSYTSLIHTYVQTSITFFYIFVYNFWHPSSICHYSIHVIKKRKCIFRHFLF